MDYEVVIPAAPKDYNKLPYLIESIHSCLIPQPQNIHVIHAGNAIGLTSLDTEIHLHHERKVLDLDPTAAVNFRRPQWIYQQFLKLFQNVSKGQLYLLIDSDLILNQPLNLFTSEGKPKFFLGVDQYHLPYFRYSTDLFGFGREYNHSFISEIMMFDKGVCNSLLELYYYFGSGKYGNPIKVNNLLYSEENRQSLITSLYNLTCHSACDEWIPADYELYGNFVEKEFPDMYEKVHIKTNLRGKYDMWTNEELEAYIDEMAKTDKDMFTAHTWI